MRGVIRCCIAVFVLFLAGCAPVDTSGLDQQAVVYHATSTIERMNAEANFRNDMAPKLAKARAVVIIPSLYKGGLLVGGEYGNGVLLVRNADGQWSYPVFCRISSGSLGLQIGAQASQTLYAIMTDEALQAILDDSFHASAEIGVSIWSAGAGRGTSATTNLSDDIYTFSLASGLFGGVMLGGGALSSRPDWNGYYYNGITDPAAILFNGGASNPQADQLRKILAQF